jgi:hypothetical protein
MHLEYNLAEFKHSQIDRGFSFEVLKDFTCDDLKSRSFWGLRFVLIFSATSLGATSGILSK